MKKFRKEDKINDLDLDNLEFEEAIEIKEKSLQNNFNNSNNKIRF